MKKANKLYCKKSKWRRREGLLLENGRIQAFTLTGGGHLAELSFAASAKVSTLNPLWVPPWRTIDAHKYAPARDTKTYGTTTEGKLLSGITGHNICLDYFGSPSPEEAKAGLSQHGEAPSRQWQIDNYATTAANATATLKVHLSAAGLHFSRKLKLCPDESILYFEETIQNERKADHFFHWTQHVTLSPAFLNDPLASVSISGSKGLISPDGYDEGRALLAAGKTFRWPKAPLAGGGSVDLSRPFSCAGFGYVAGVQVKPSREIGFVAGLNPTEGLLIGYCFARSDFPWITVWEENRAVQAVPWKGKTQALGLEFGTTPIPTTRRANFLKGGPLFDTQTATYIPALGKRTVRYIAFLAHVPATFTHLRDVCVGKNEILLFSSSSGVPLRLQASAISQVFR
jgi:hypothetical protein